jgi:hypothetical protein
VLSATVPNPWWYLDAVWEWTEDCRHLLGFPAFDAFGRLWVAHPDNAAVDRQGCDQPVHEAGQGDNARASDEGGAVEDPNAFLRR